MEQIRRERRNRTVTYPRNPIGRVRRRWPRMYDGDIPAGEALRREQGGVATDDLSGPRSSGGFSMQTLRQSPIRNGLIGLAVAGTAAPIAINRYQQAMRTDPSHESLTALRDAGEDLDDLEVSDAWQAMDDAEDIAAAERTATIDESLQKYAEYSLDRGLAETIYDAALENNIDPQIAFGLVRAESSFRNTSTSPVGAVGLTQLMPKTASWLEPGVTRADLRKPETNLKIGFKYLRQLTDKYEGDTKLALLAYNRGPGTVDREIRNGRNPDNGYADFVEGKENHGHSLYTR